MSETKTILNPTKPNVRDFVRLSDAGFIVAKAGDEWKVVRNDENGEILLHNAMLQYFDRRARYARSTDTLGIP